MMPLRSHVALIIGMRVLSGCTLGCENAMSMTDAVIEKATYVYPIVMVVKLRVMKAR